MLNVAWEATVLADPLIELSVHERRTLLRIANGDARSGTHDPADVRRLQLLALIEDEGPFIHMTALGKQRVERLAVTRRKP
jgi:hypothetical protein